MDEEEINALYLPKMTLQPVVENAIVHGLEKVEHKGEIRLRLYRTQSKLVIVVSDYNFYIKVPTATAIGRGVSLFRYSDHVAENI